MGLLSAEFPCNLAGLSLEKPLTLRLSLSTWAYSLKKYLPIFSLHCKACVLAVWQPSSYSFNLCIFRLVLTPSTTHGLLQNKDCFNLSNVLPLWEKGSNTVTWNSHKNVGREIQFFFFLLKLSTNLPYFVFSPPLNSHFQRQLLCEFLSLDEFEVKIRSVVSYPHCWLDLAYLGLQGPLVNIHMSAFLPS